MHVAWRLIRIIAGFVLLAFGLVAILIPVLPQVPFIIAGLLLLAREFHWARRLLEWAKRRWHSLRDAARGAEAKD
ncbi:MAG TPA: PGPGW domain-containing protein [Candidatus Acidoferrales bacterium]|nr:PGPGW domain-containing protein [Candidatus Acidoferrales bacterium]